MEISDCSFQEDALLDDDTSSKVTFAPSRISFGEYIIENQDVNNIHPLYVRFDMIRKVIMLITKQKPENNSTKQYAKGFDQVLEKICIPAEMIDSCSVHIDPTNSQEQKVLLSLKCQCLKLVKGMIETNRRLMKAKTVSFYISSHRDVDGLLSELLGSRHKGLQIDSTNPNEVSKKVSNESVTILQNTKRLQVGESVSHFRKTVKRELPSWLRNESGYKMRKCSVTYPLETLQSDSLHINGSNINTETCNVMQDPDLLLTSNGFQCQSEQYTLLYELHNHADLPVSDNDNLGKKSTSDKTVNKNKVSHVATSPAQFLSQNEDILDKSKQKEKVSVVSLGQQTENSCKTKSVLMDTTLPMTINKSQTPLQQQYTEQHFDNKMSHGKYASPSKDHMIRTQQSLPSKGIPGSTEVTLPSQKFHNTFQRLRIHYDKKVETSNKRLQELIQDLNTEVQNNKPRSNSTDDPALLIKEYKEYCERLKTKIHLLKTSIKEWSQWKEQLEVNIIKLIDQYEKEMKKEAERNARSLQKQMIEKMHQHLLRFNPFEEYGQTSNISC